jgi:hypothetical protein
MLTRPPPEHNHPRAFRPLPVTRHELTLGDYRKYPACRMVLTCALCGWSKGYNPERVLDRLRQLRAGGHATPVGQLARRVGWNCPGCNRVQWRTDLAWPVDLGAREVKRLAGHYRN